MRTPSDLHRPLAELAAALAPVAAGDSDLAGLAAEVVAGIEAHAIPRLERPGEPMVVAVTGLTGVGKSTLVNALAGATVSPTGPIRPTTVEPVVVNARSVTEPTPLVAQLTLVDLPAGPGHRLAPQADLHLFVTTPARYADAEGWDHLSGIAERAIPVWVVLAGVGDEDAEVVDDFRHRLAEADLAVPLVVLPDVAEDPGAVAGLAADLSAYAASPPPGAGHLRVAALVEQADAVAGTLRERAAAGEELLTAVDGAYGPVGTVAVEMAGPDGVAGRVSGAAERPWDEVVDRLALVLTHRIGAAASAAAARWATHPEGAALLDGDGVELWRHGPATTVLARDTLLTWPGLTEELVTARLRPRRWWQRPVLPAEVTAEVKRSALGGADSVTRRERNRLDRPFPEVVDEARGLLGRLAVAVVDADRQRFVERLRSLDPGRAAVVERAADAARDVLEEVGAGA